MWFFFVEAAVFVVVFLIWFFNRQSKTVKVGDQRVKLSKPARLIVKEFKQIPESNRPYPVRSLYSALVALDIRYDIDKVNHAHTVSCFEGSYFSWTAPGRRRHVMPEYFDMFKSIQAVINAGIEREKKLATAAIASDLDRVDELIQGLRTEANILRDITKELV